VTKTLVAKIAAGALAAAGAAVAIVVLVSGGDTTAGQPGVWIDDPLHDSSVPIGPVPVMAHAADASGISAMEFAVDDVVLATQDVAGAPAFWLATFEWSADQPGSAVIRVRSRNTSGQWGTPAYATIHIGQTAPRPDPTAPPSTPPATPPITTPQTTAPHTTPPHTTAPPSTAPPTTTPACLDLVAPDLATPPHRAVVSTVAPALVWRYSGRCTPGGFQIQVSSARDFSAIDRSGNTDGSTTQWTVSPGLPDCQTWYWRVRAYTGRTVGGWSSPYAFDVRVGRCP
jgi:hypothetical protein